MFVVFDLSKPSTLNCVIEWKEIIDFMVRQKNGNPIPAFLLPNKVIMIIKEVFKALAVKLLQCDGCNVILWFL